MADKTGTNLVIVRAGSNSLHHEWLAGQHRDFDLFVSWYGQESYRGPAEYVEATAGLKWPAISQLCSRRWDLVQHYDAVWIPDDDLRTDANTISSMFELFHRYRLWLAQPGLTSSSFINHPITAAMPGTRLRFTNFVEIMCPMFDRATLKRLRGTLGESVSGWGLDFLWPYLLGYPKDRIAILDGTPVTHTRPFRSGPFYERCAAMGIAPMAECRELLGRFGMVRKRPRVQETVPISRVADETGYR